MAEELQVHYIDLGVPRVTDLKGPLTIGRTEGNDVILNHPSVSRKHARIEPRGDKWWIVDLKSTNGVKVNNNLITEAGKGPTTFVELDTRQSDGYTVSLEWDRATGRTQLVVGDIRNASQLVFPVPQQMPAMLSAIPFRYRQGSLAVRPAYV